MLVAAYLIPYLPLLKQEILFMGFILYPIKEKTPDYRTLECGGFHVKIFNARRIVVNGEKCTSSREAKFVIGEYLE